MKVKSRSHMEKCDLAGFANSVITKIWINLFKFELINLFVNLQVRAQLILLHLRGAQMTLAAFQEQFSFKFLPKTVIRKFWRSQCARQQVPDRWSTHRKSTRTRSHCSCPRYSQFQMSSRTQKLTTSNRQNSDAVIGEVDRGATMKTFVDQGGHLECHSPHVIVLWIYDNLHDVKDRKSIFDIITELPFPDDLENPGQLPVQEVLEGTDDCVL